MIILVVLGAAMQHTAWAAGIERASSDYVRGFIDGALLTDEAVLVRVDQESKNTKDGFEDRALRTRIGNRASKLPATYYADFCIPENVSREQVIKNIQQQVNTLPKDSFTSAAVYDAVKKLYPCN